MVIDLEDAVPLGRKGVARDLAAEALSGPGQGVAHLVRVNPASEPGLLNEDVDALRDVLAAVDAVILPKAMSSDDVTQLSELLSMACAARAVTTPVVIPTIENAVGVRECGAIAAAGPSVQTLMFGAVDLSADLGVIATADGLELLTARSTTVLACAAAGLARPIDGPYLNIKDVNGLETATRHARALGFGGKVVIHPDQLRAVTRTFAPTSTEIDWARRVVVTFEASLADGVGVARMEDGTFIDAPVAEQARRLLRTAKAAEDLA